MTEIFDSKNIPLLTRQEQYFHKYYAEGALVRANDNIFRLGIWNESENIMVEDKETSEKKSGKGYVLECEIIMSKHTAIKIRDLLTYKLKELEESKVSEGELEK